MLDLKIINGQVIDGTGAPSCQADVGVRDGKIVLGSGEDAREILDARGKYVCPGFVDAHSHGDGILGTVYGECAKPARGSPQRWPASAENPWPRWCRAIWKT